MKKKLLTAFILVFCAVALVVGSVLTTIALLTSSAGVSNMFTVGNISISMWESKVNSDGTLVDPLQKVDTNSYHLVPGKTYVKDPTIYIEKGLGSADNVVDEMYLFVKSANMIRSAEAGNFNDRTDATPLSMREQMEKYGWVEFVRSDDGAEIVWVYGERNATTGEITPTVITRNAKQKILQADGSRVERDNPGEFRLCDGFTTHKYVDTSVYGAASVTFTGFAVQTTGFGTGSETGNALTTAAWKALKESFPYKCGIDNPVNPYDLSMKGEDAYKTVGPRVGEDKAPDAVFELLTPPKKESE